jgi:hypothetical protein
VSGFGIWLGLFEAEGLKNAMMDVMEKEDSLNMQTKEENLCIKSLMMNLADVMLQREPKG